MKQLTTIRIYFEYGQKVNDTSFWKKMTSSDFSTELIKRAKALDIEQVLSFNVTKGYFNKGKIHWGISETKNFRHPHVVEIIDTDENISKFLNQEKELLEKRSIFIVKNEVLLHKNN